MRSSTTFHRETGIALVHHAESRGRRVADATLDYNWSSIRQSSWTVRGYKSTRGLQAFQELGFRISTFKTMQADVFAVLFSKPTFLTKVNHLVRTSRKTFQILVRISPFYERHMQSRKASPALSVVTREGSRACSM